MTVDPKESAERLRERIRNAIFDHFAEMDSRKGVETVNVPIEFSIGALIEVAVSFALVYPTKGERDAAIKFATDYLIATEIATERGCAIGLVLAELNDLSLN